VKRYYVITTAVLLLFLTACGAKPTVNEPPTTAPQETVTEKPTAEETASIETTDTTVSKTTATPKTTVKPTAVVSDPTKPVRTTEKITVYVGTTRVDNFIVKEVDGTVLTLSHYDIDTHDELKAGLYRGDYGETDGSADMHFKVGDIVTVRYDVQVKETSPFQITIREICPTAWNN